MAIILTDYIGLTLYAYKEARMIVGSSVHVKGSSLWSRRITVQAESNFKIAQRSNRGIEYPKGIVLPVRRYVLYNKHAIVNQI